MSVKTKCLHFVRKFYKLSAYAYGKFEVPFLKVDIKKFLAQVWLSSTRYFGDLTKSLRQPLKIDFDMNFRSVIFP